ncbi:MAG: putative PEP-binding protein [Pseudomonadota bacterium]
MILRGVPLIPGHARGRLTTRMEGDLAGRILLLDQRDIPSLLKHADKPPAGLIVRNAARFGHILIRLFALGIPTLLLEGDQAASLVPGGWFELDGEQGLLGDESLPVPPAKPKGGQHAWRMADGEPIELMASVSDARGAAEALRRGATAIGLVRSEYLHPEPPAVPDAAFYIKALGEVLEAAHPLPVTVRMFDYGPDKPIPWWPEAPIAPLGWQGSRLYGLETISSVLDAELAALEDMGGDGRLSLLVPYLTHPWEFEAIRARLQRWPRLARLPLGAMVETPAAAFALPEWRAKADFVGIGCNDLMQAFHATDRNRPELDRWLDPYAPAWLRFLTRLAEEGRGLGLPLRICGQLPGVPGFFPLLLGMGFRAFSVEPVMIPTLGHIARTMDASVAHDLLGQACRASTSAEVRTLLGLSPDRPGR